jgi:hypothetical protein
MITSGGKRNSRTPTEADVLDTDYDASAQPVRARDPYTQQCPSTTTRQ